MSSSKVITRPIWILGLVSLFTDFASEMLYPVMPIYLREIGFSVLLIGILEGVAEAVAGLSKGFFGQQSDRRGERVPFIRTGYGLSAMSKPMLALFIYPWWVFLARTVDRLGKGVRTGARDALLSAYAGPENKGRVFGFHRSLDTFGAVLGPLAALLFLAFFPKAYRPLFFLAFIPGLLAVGLTFLLRDPPLPPQPVGGGRKLLDFLRYPSRSRQDYRRLLTGLVGFALFNSSDLFLLLLLKEAGLGDEVVLTAYIFYNIVFAILAFPLGILADRFGLRRTLIGGLLAFGAVYSGMAYGLQMPQWWFFFVLFFLYGAYAAATEGVAKAWISRITPLGETGTAIGTYEAFKSVAAIVASAVAGGVWQWLGPVATFGLTALGAFLTVGYLLLFTANPERTGG